jgi:hypothetical protein
MPPKEFFASSPSINTPEKKKFVYGLIGDKRVVTVDRYRGSRDGFKLADFHSRADNKGPTITLFTMTSGDIIGGITHA